MNPFRILLLGPPQIVFEQTSLDIPTHLHKLILYYLAARGCLLPQEELERVFSNPTEAFPDGLEATFSRLNDDSPDGELVVIKDDLVGLDFERTYIDHLHFRDLLDDAGRVPWQIPRDQSLPRHNVELLNQALDLWSGELFLEKVDFSDKPQAKQEVQEIAKELQKLRESVLERLADHYYIEGDFQSAEKMIQLALEMNNPSDYLYELRMKVFIEQGQLPQAREYYGKVAKMMQAQGRIGPPPGLTALYQEIKGDTHVDIPEPRPAWDIHPCVNVPLVGREKIFSQLALARKQRQNILLLGEAGKGKTRILKEYANNVSPWHTVFNVACKPNEVNLPFQPFISLFRHEVIPNIWLELSPAWASSLSHILPEIAMMRTDIEDGANRPQESSVLMEAIRQTFKLLAAQKPILLVFDDIQHADSETLQTFTYLLGRYPFKNGRGMLIGSARESELAKQHSSLLHSLRDSKHIDFVRTQGLSTKAISKLSYHVLQESPSKHFVRTLSKESGGNPLFILEMLRSILDTGRKPDLTSQEKFPLNEKLSTVIRNRLSELDSTAYRVLEAVAVLGTDFDLSLVPLISKIEEEESISIIETLVKSNLIAAQKEAEETGIKYRFVHNKVREVLLQNMSQARRLILHNRAALIKVDEGAESAIIAAHYEGAKKFAPAFYYWVKAGEKARALASTREATRAFQQAESLLNKHNLTPSKAHLYRFFSTWSAIAFETQNIELVERLNHSLLEIGKERGEDLLIGAAWGNLSDACMARGQYKKGLKYTNRALISLNERQHLIAYIENLVRKGVFLYMLNKLDKAEEIYQDALALGLECEEGPEIFSALANAHYQMAMTNNLNLRPRTALKHAELCLEHARKGNHPHRELTGYAMLAFSQYHLGRYQAGRTATQSGFDLAKCIQSWRICGYMHAYRAMLDLAEGKVDSAWEHADQAEETGQRFALQDILGLGKRVKGDIYRILQANDKAQGYYSAGYDSVPEHFIGFDNLYHQGLVLAQSGDIERGRALIREGKEKMDAASVGIGAAMALLAWEAVSLLENDLEQAMRLNTKIHKLVHESGCVSYTLANRISLGHITFQEGNYPLAEEHFRSVVQEAAALPNPWIEVEAHLAWEKVLEAMGKEASQRAEDIIRLLDDIQANLTEGNLLPHYQTFRQRVLARESNPIRFI
ncbi:MAG: hypothetical protein MAG431_02215 [Chloroflexi bacterium]|nr:hypothetical protein [Chloroflexota bacterium]